MEEQQYYKNVYSKFWIEQTKKYGYGSYNENLVRLIAQSSPQRIFEVGIGTGWPIGAALKEKGIEIDGCDIAENSVAIAQKELENEKGIWVGEIFDYKGDNEIYDVVYCVRASWCISDFYKVVKKMISMTRGGGHIVFDVMDKNSLYCRKLRLSDALLKYYKFLGIHVDDVFGHHFVSLMRMKFFLRKNGLTYQCWSERELTHNEDTLNTPKVVFCCRKEK